jgi:PST family polysaccharide transporter
MPIKKTIFCTIKQRSFAVNSPTSFAALERLVMSENKNRQFFFNTLASWSVNILKSCIQLFLIPVMARLLSPEDYGIYALAFPTILFFAALADGGLGSSMSREDEANNDTWSTAFWVMLLICSGLALIIAAAAFIFSYLTGEVALASLMPVLSLVLPLIALTVLADARLTRRGNLIYHSAAELVAFAIGAIAAILVAIHGGGYWSLAAQYLVSYFIRAVVMNVAAGVVPSFVFKPSLLAVHLNIGGALILSRACELIGKSIENALYGNLFGIASLGNYTFASQIARFGCDAATNPVIGSFYARALHDSDYNVAALHGRLTRALLLTLIPITAYLAILAPVIFPIFLGHKWGEAASLLSLIIVPYGFASIAWLSSQITLKHGLASRTASIVSICSLFRALAVLLGYVFTLRFVVLIIAISFFIQALMITISVPRRYRFDIPIMLRTLCRPALILIVSCSVVVSIRIFSSSDLIVTCFSAMVGLIAYVVGLLLFGGPAIKSDIRAFKMSNFYRTRS